MLHRVAALTRHVRRAWMPALALIAMVALLGLAVAAREAPIPEPALAEDARAEVVQPADAPAVAEVATPTPTPEPAPTPTPEPTPAPTPSPVPLPTPVPDADEAADPVALVPAPDHLQAFAGLSTWVDVYDVEWTPEQQAAVAAKGGAQAIYVQSARHVSDGHIHDPERLGRLIEAAHDWGLQVMVWYIPDFVHPEQDLARAKAAISFTTPRGDRPDAFGLDIELEDQPDIALRNERLLALSRELREWVGPDYPMAAVVLPPLQLDLRPDWWPNFPWRELDAYYDVWVPMSYSSFRGTDADTTYRWNLENIRELRRRVGDPDLPIHLAGGIADDLPHVDAFVDAARDGGVLGAGLYDLDTTPPSAWPWLRALRAP